ncbi:hypothetical protein HGM15179_004126 [Zosterops borbonicus]|uniref:Uncharacterized protein n=1 Tax=Zosterops borbonicus TaxID=364589 RepID=A0A8K1LQV8_9PASS|nr:hypothetical protein HGM15179_004126 [Zosterops borbonicus]
MEYFAGAMSITTRLEPEQIESSPAEKDLRILRDERLSMSCQPRTKYILGCIKGSVAGRERILSLCSAVVRPHLQCCIQLWGSQHRKDMDLLERVQRKPPRLLGWDLLESKGPLTMKKLGDSKEAYTSPGPVGLHSLAPGVTDTGAAMQA